MLLKSQVCDVFNIVTGQNLENHDAAGAQTLPTASQKANFHFICCHSVHFYLVFLHIFVKYFDFILKDVILTK